MTIKSLEELKKIREQSKNKVNLRDSDEIKGDKIEVLVGMGTCGISAGARETLNTFIKELANEKIENVKVITVGCIGYCHSEPTVQVNIPGQKPVLYGKVNKDKVNKIIQDHIKGGEIVNDLVLKVDFNRA